MTEQCIHDLKTDVAVIKSKQEHLVKTMDKIEKFMEKNDKDHTKMFSKLSALNVKSGVWGILGAFVGVGIWYLKTK